MKKLWPLIIATFISDFGSSLTIAALPALFILNGRTDGIGIFNGFDAAGGLIGSLWAMAFIDRFRKNRIAAISDVVRALLFIPLILMETLSVPVIAAFAVVQAIFGATTLSAVQSWIGEHCFNEAEIKSANSLLEGTSQIARAIAPLVGVGILAVSSVKTVFIIDGISYVLGAALVWKLSSTLPKRESAYSFTEEVSLGFRYAIRNPEILKWILISVIQGFGFALFNTFYLEILSTGTQANEQQITFFQTAFFLGSLIGTTASMKGSVKAQRLLFLGTLICSGALLASIGVTNYWVYFAIATIQSIGRMMTVIATRTLVQTRSDSKMIGRVMALRSAVIDVGSIVAYSVAVGLVTKVSITVALTTAATTFLISILALSRSAHGTNAQTSV